MKTISEPHPQGPRSPLPRTGFHDGVATKNKRRMVSSLPRRWDAEAAFDSGDCAGSAVGAAATAQNALNTQVIMSAGINKSNPIRNEWPR